MGFNSGFKGLILPHSIGKYAGLLKEVGPEGLLLQCWGWVPNHAVSQREGVSVC